MCVFIFWLPFFFHLTNIHWTISMCHVLCWVLGYRLDIAGPCLYSWPLEFTHNLVYLHVQGPLLGNKEMISEVLSMESELMKSLRLSVVPWKNAICFIFTMIELQPWDGDSEDTGHELTDTVKLILCSVRSGRHHYELVYAICVWNNKILTFSWTFLKCIRDSDPMMLTWEVTAKEKEQSVQWKWLVRALNLPPKSPRLESDGV